MPTPVIPMALSSSCLSTTGKDTRHSVREMHARGPSFNSNHVLLQRCNLQVEREKRHHSPPRPPRPVTPIAPLQLPRQRLAEQLPLQVHPDQRFHLLRPAERHGRSDPVPEQAVDIVQVVITDRPILRDRAIVQREKGAERWTLPGGVTVVPHEIGELAVALFTDTQRAVAIRFMQVAIICLRPAISSEPPAADLPPEARLQCVKESRRFPLCFDGYPQARTPLSIVLRCVLFDDQPLGYEPGQSRRTIATRATPSHQSVVEHQPVSANELLGPHAAKGQPYLTNHTDKPANPA